MEMARDINFGVGSDGKGMVRSAPPSGGAVPHQTSGSDVRGGLMAIREAWRRADWASVIAGAEALLKISPQHPDALKMQLKAAVNSGRLDVAAQAAVAVAEEQPSVAFLAARKLIGARDWETAAAVLVALRQAGFGEADGWDTAVAKVAFNLLKSATQARTDGDDERYRHLLRLGVAVEPDNALLRRKMDALRAELVEQARAQEFEKDPEGFVAAWERVLDMDQRHVTAIKRLAGAAEKTGDQHRAMVFWARLLEIDLTNTAAAQRLARAAGRSGREHDALAVLHEAGLATPDGEHVAHLVHKVRGACKLAFRAGDALGAAHHLALLFEVGETGEEMETLRRKVVSVLSRELKAFRRGEPSADPVTAATLLLRLDPANVAALTALARHLYQARDFVDAGRYYQRLTEAAPDVAVNWLHLARARHRAGDLQGAFAAVSQSRALAPGDGAAENLATLLRTKLPA